MRLGAQLVGDLRKMLAEELRAGERAAMAAIRTETAEVKAELRQQVTTAFAGNARGIANAWPDRPSGETPCPVPLARMRAC
jgi:hypothetical protein